MQAPQAATSPPLALPFAIDHHPASSRGYLGQTFTRGHVLPVFGGRSRVGKFASESGARKKKYRESKLILLQRDHGFNSVYTKGGDNLLPGKHSAFININKAGKSTGQSFAGIGIQEPTETHRRAVLHTRHSPRDHDEKFERLEKHFNISSIQIKPHLQAS
jgi:hypothetical protein